MGPRPRGICLALLIAGATVCTHPYLLLTAWLVLALVAASIGLAGMHLRLTLAFIVPVALGSLLINGLLQPIQIGAAWWMRFVAAIPATLVTSARLAVIAAAIQISIVPLIGDRRLVIFLRRWHCPERALIVAVGAITLIAELRLRSRQVLDARLAQGKGSATGWGALRQLPFLLMPLTIYMLDAAASRSDLWARRDLLERFSRYGVDEADRSGAVPALAAVGLCSVWFVTAAWSRLQ